MVFFLKFLRFFNEGIMVSPFFQPKKHPGFNPHYSCRKNPVFFKIYDLVLPRANPEELRG